MKQNINVWKNVNKIKYINSMKHYLMNKKFINVLKNRNVILTSLNTFYHKKQLLLKNKNNK